MKNVCLLLLGLFLSLSVYSQKIHFILVIEKEDINFGLLNLRNEELMVQILETVKWGLDYPMETTYLSQNKFTAATLKQTITNLKTNPKDIVMVYFAGFGIAQPDEKNLFANWKLRDNAATGLAVAEVEQWLIAKQRAKKLHLGLILSECSEQTIRPRQNLAASMGATVDLRKPVIRKLFLENCGIIKMGSSLPYQPAWVNQKLGASLFTSSFHQAFELMLNPSDSSDLKYTSFQELQRMTSMYMGQYFVDMEIAQTPVLEIKSCKGAAASVTIGPVPDSLIDQTKVLNGLLNGLAQNKDSLQRAKTKKQIMAYFTPNATVVVDSYYMNDPNPEQKNYPIQQYLGEIHWLRSNPKLSVMRLAKQYLFIEKMETNDLNTTTKKRPVKMLNIVEYLGDGMTSR